MSISLSLDAEVLPKAIREFAPQWGIVLGSGLGSLVDEVDAMMSVPYEEITGMPVSTVSGHAGRFVFGRLAGRRVLVAQGRVHLYEGRTAEEVTAAVRFMDARGVKKLVLTNAAGSLRPDFAPGTWMMLSDHLNLTGTSPLLGGANFVDMSAVYSAEWRAHFLRLAAEESIALHHGVYAGLLGPQYETPAEVRMLRALGADAVGMSTVLEAIQARALGMEVAAFSCLTNMAAGLSAGTLDHGEVLATGRASAEQLVRLLARALPRNKARYRDESCRPAVLGGEPLGADFFQIVLSLDWRQPRILLETSQSFPRRETRFLLLRRCRERTEHHDSIPGTNADLFPGDGLAQPVWQIAHGFLNGQRLHARSLAIRRVICQSFGCGVSVFPSFRSSRLRKAFLPGHLLLRGLGWAEFAPGTQYSQPILPLPGSTASLTRMRHEALSSTTACTPGSSARSKRRPPRSACSARSVRMPWA